MALFLVTPPAAEPVTLAAARAHLRVDGATEDAHILGLISAACLEVEAFTGRALVTQAWRLTRPDWPTDAVLILPKPPLLAVTAIATVDQLGATVTLPGSAYTVTAPAGPWAPHGTVVPAYGTGWPAVRAEDANAVRIDFQAGYGDAAAVPGPLKSAILLLLADLFENREAQAERALAENPAVQRLLLPFRAAWWE